MLTSLFVASMISSVGVAPVLATAGGTSAKMMVPPSYPLPRVKANIESQLAKTPNDAHLNYVLGRVYYTQLCSKDPGTVKMYSEVPPYRFSAEYPHAWDFAQLKLAVDESTISTANNSFKYLNNAIKLDKNVGLYHLTLACVYEASANIASNLNPKATKKSWLAEALKEYKSAFRLTVSSDLKEPYGQRPLTYERFISDEAANGILRLDSKSKEASAAKKHLATLQSKSGGPITPIIFSMNRQLGLGDLLDTSKSVQFDLDGTGTPQQVNWVKPETMFLVWLPNTKVKISSGRQLFGNATFWLLFENGFDAMSVLDDNGDNWLKGKELQNLAVWQDLNQDGTSSPNEIKSIASLGIVGFATEWKKRLGESYANEGGILLQDGQTLPLFDWVTRTTE